MQRVAFDYAQPAKTPLIKLMLTKRTQFTLLRQNERTYILTIPDASPLAKQFTLPHFPPHDFAGFTHLQFTSESRTLRVTIGVERGIKIAANASGSEVWLRTVTR